jgi:hypothetical protein
LGFILGDFFTIVSGHPEEKQFVCVIRHALYLLLTRENSELCRNRAPQGEAYFVDILLMTKPDLNMEGRMAKEISFI